jgi:hypothetical protein
MRESLDDGGEECHFQVLNGSMLAGLSVPSVVRSSGPAKMP